MAIIKQIDEANEWMRLPDTDDNVSMTDLVDWVNARPVSVLLMAKYEIERLRKAIQNALDSMDLYNDVSTAADVLTKALQQKDSE